MPAHLDPSAAHSDAPTESSGDHDALRLLSRSPHPYHRQNFELLEPAGRIPYKPPSSTLRPDVDGDPTRSATAFPAVSRETTPTSDSGTEADDEHFLKGLPAPRARLHKGLRGRNELVSEHSTPLPSPALEEGNRRTPYTIYPLKKETGSAKDARAAPDISKRNKEIVRRATECLILGSLGAMVQTNRQVQPVLYKWRIELYTGIGCMLVLVLLYPVRLVLWGYYHRLPSRRLPLSIPASFDPAALLYPPAITLLVSSLIAVDNEAILLPNIILAICSLPSTMFPGIANDQLCNPLHWLVSCVPLFVSRNQGIFSDAGAHGDTNVSSMAAVLPETAVLLYPLHQYLCMTMQSLTTTSLLIAELQLLSVALINVLFLSSSPQAAILKAVLWVGGLDILVLCSRVVSWGIALARVPKWRFKRATSPTKRSASFWSSLMSWKRVRHDLFHAPMDSSSCSSCEAHDEPEDSDDGGFVSNGLSRAQTVTFDGADSTGFDGRTYPQGDVAVKKVRSSDTEEKIVSNHVRRHTLPVIGNIPKKRSHTHTPSGRKKRSASSSVRQFFSLTQGQATTRKWTYALYVYICIVGTILGPFGFASVKDSIQDNALRGHEPIGWALGYFFGDLPWFRWEVISRNLERWICLPTRAKTDTMTDGLGWVQHLRHVTIGEANTRLFLCAYCIAVIGVGLMVVFRLSPFYEVDTRRKVFHFMMVAMFAPSIYIDPTYVALALSIVLAVFLLLDLLRASQLPPLSKPLASFLAPYVDGRDLRGPVVISHIFLLIGCAIPLWLSLASLPRTGTGYLEGWEVPTREVSMISGVVCVGLGDAAASLIGRRYGHRKWLWGGGKSLEGSVAFAIAVFLGLLAAHTWLRVGGWPSTTELDTWGVLLQKMGVCAGIASLNEAVLTGGNDNVIVPVVLWTCVKSLGV